MIGPTILVCLVAGALGCQSRRLQNHDLPGQPIALMHWEDRAAKFRSESFAGAADLPPAPLDRFDPEAAEERELRAHLQAEENQVLASKLTKYPGRLVLYWPQTGVLERIEAAPIGSRPLAWSPDHTRLLFVSNHREGKDQLYEYHLERKDLSALTTGPEEHPRGDYDAKGRLVILRTDRARDGGIERTVHVASTGARIERSIPSEVPPGTLRFAPDGDQIVYEQVRSRPRTVGAAVMESFVATRRLVEDAEEQILTRGREPSLTPDGQWIVFASPSSAGYRLRRMRPDGTLRVPIGPGGSEERMPTVSPDGEFIAFIQEVSGRRQLAVRGFDGKDGRMLLTSGWSEFPVW